ncbi:MAG: glucokinase [Gammaproteobacteria bacterium]|nr:glucokinase [Gammaproteobacteria bacterium]
MDTLQSGVPHLIADIGGTHARFALVDNSGGVPFETKTLNCGDYATLLDAVEFYLADIGSPRPHHAGFSIATAVEKDQLTMTNHIWDFSIQQTRKSLGLSSLKVLNDYAALALALPYLTTADYSQICGDQAPNGKVMAVLGPGTGLGVSAVTQIGKHWAPLQGEGGHVSYGPQNEREVAVINTIRQRIDHVSAECLVSGSGLLLIYSSIAELDGIKPEPLKPQEISAKAMNKTCVVAEEALSMFCAVLGTVAGNLALTIGAHGGVFIGGGIVPKLREYFLKSQFRQRFDRHGRLTGYLQDIPTYLIESKYPALRGAAVALGQNYQNLGITSAED